MTAMKHTRDFNSLSGRRLKSLLIQLCERAQDDVKRLPRHEETATHQLRVRMKKILALLRLARPAVEEHTLKAMRLHTRAVKNACACNRDEVVRCHLIDKLARRFHLEPKHRPQLAGVSHEKPSTAHLRHQLHALCQLIDSTPIETLEERRILEQHARCYRKGRRLMKQACETAECEILHRWRHRVKDLSYQTLALSHLPGAARRSKRARRLARVLGRDQDLANLAREPAFSVRRSPWMQVINERRGELRERYLALGHKLYAPHSSRFSGRILCRA